LNWFNFEVITMHKNDVLSATHAALNVLEELRYKSRGLGVYNVIELSSGKCDATALIGANIGSDCGLLRVAPSGYYPNYPDIVGPNLVV
jgi:hypothetical protein